jgi:site-specific DNA recombinase
MRVAVYARVSTRQQMQSQSTEQQLDRLQAHVQAQGWSLPPENIFRDDGCSGATLVRPGLDRLRDRVSAAQLDRVILTAPDRLARNYVHQVLLIEELQRSGCQVEFLDRPMSNDPHDQLLLQIRGAVAEYERTLIAERMRRGRLAKQQAGLLLPWSKPPYGYRLHPERPRDPAGVRTDAAEAAVVAEIYARYLQEGSTLGGLVQYLYDQGIPSPSGNVRWGIASLRGVLTNLVYTGQVYAGRMRYRAPRIRRSATHRMGQPHKTAIAVPREEWILVSTLPAVISQEQFDLVQAKLSANQAFAKRHNTAHQYLLRALVSCGQCQLACIARTARRERRSRATGQNGGYGYYLCSGKTNLMRSHREDKCTSRYIPAQALDELVWGDLCELLTQPQHILHALERAHGGKWLPQELQARRENLRRGQVSLEQQLHRLTEAYLSEVIPLPEYKRRRHDLEQRQQALKRQEQQLASQVQGQAKVAGLATSVEEFCQRVQSGLSNATFEQRRQLIELLVDRVIVSEAEVEIRYVIPTSPSAEHTRFCHLRSDYFSTPYVSPK